MMQHSSKKRIRVVIGPQWNQSERRKPLGRPKKRRPREHIVPVDVTDRISYIDTICLKLAVEPPEYWVKHLTSSTIGTPDIQRRSIRLTRETVADGIKVLLLTIQRPSFNTLDLLDSLQDGDFIGPAFTISRVHIALDLTTTHERAANKLQEFVVMRLVPNYLRDPRSWLLVNAEERRRYSPPTHGPDDLGKNTAYLGFDTKRGHRVAVYSSRRSKVREDCFCTHIEWRHEGASTVARAGLDTTEQLRQLDHRAFWEEHLRMMRGRLTNSTQPREISSPDLRKRLASKTVGTEEAQATQAQTAHYTYMQTKTTKSQNSAMSLLLPQSHQWLLPCRENALWDIEWERRHTKQGALISAVNKRSSGEKSTIADTW